MFFDDDDDDDQMDTEAPFSAAFSGSDGWGWVSRVIGVGASFGILTSLLVSMLGQARYLCVIARSNVVPVWLARVNPSTSTPVNASAFLGILILLLIYIIISQTIRYLNQLILFDCYVFRSVHSQHCFVH